MSSHKNSNRIDNSDQHFTIKSGGDAAEADMWLSDMGAATSTKHDER
eukprot:SAG11_NODE_61_length_19011_cov_49.624048_13_plen_47_part_00